MMRPHRLALVTASSALMLALEVPFSIAGAASNAAGVQVWPEINGIYWTTSYRAKIQPVRGGVPPSPAGPVAGSNNAEEPVKHLPPSRTAAATDADDAVGAMIAVSLRAFHYLASHRVAPYAGEHAVHDTAQFAEKACEDG